jgi:benzoyl-CoA reductase/2-hydroxyglutaryl-CoA dehydratase subunit BcrC/BadD/HgdB
VPVQLIRAAGYTPYRILPETTAPDEAGRLMHDSMCSHVKQVLNRAMGNDLPDLEGIVFVNSCDAMRRLAAAWRAARPRDRVLVLDLPSVLTSNAISFYAHELSRLVRTLSSWRGAPVTEESILDSMSVYNDVVALGPRLRARSTSTGPQRTYRTVQEFYNLACTRPAEAAIAFAQRALSGSEGPADRTHEDAVPIYLFGNVLAAPDVFTLIESCGAFIVGDDLCTGSRGIRHVDLDHSTDVLSSVSTAILAGGSCARLVDPGDLDAFAKRLASRARAADARAVIGHTPKFCDPYLAHVPVVRDVLRAASLPLLMLEGPCMASSFAGHRVRIEAFVEQLR